MYGHKRDKSEIKILKICERREKHLHTMLGS